MSMQDRAFPIVIPSDHNWHIEDGLTKREYYACAAMQGLLAQSEWEVATRSGIRPDCERVADLSVRYADALAKALAPAQPVNDNESGGKG